MIETCCNCCFAGSLKSNEGGRRRLWKYKYETGEVSNSWACAICQDGERGKNCGLYVFIYLL